MPTYQVDTERFFSWFTDYLEELSRSRAFDPQKELGLKNYSPVFVYAVEAIKFPSSPQSVRIRDLEASHFPMDRPYRFGVRYGIHHPFATFDMSATIGGEIFEIDIEPLADEVSISNDDSNPRLSEFFQEFRQAIEWEFPVPTEPSDRDESNHYGFPEQQKQIADLIATGFSSSLIAEKLTISVKTVESQRERMISKVKLQHGDEYSEWTKGELLRRLISAGYGRET